MTSEEAIKYLREAAEWITEMADHDFEEDKHGKWCKAIDISIDTLESLQTMRDLLHFLERSTK